MDNDSRYRAAARAAAGSYSTHAWAIVDMAASCSAIFACSTHDDHLSCVSWTAEVLHCAWSQLMQRPSMTGWVAACNRLRHGSRCSSRHCSLSAIFAVHLQGAGCIAVTCGAGAHLSFSVRCGSSLQCAHQIIMPQHILTSITQKLLQLGMSLLSRAQTDVGTQECLMMSILVPVS